MCIYCRFHIFLCASIFTSQYVSLACRWTLQKWKKVLPCFFRSLHLSDSYEKNSFVETVVSQKVLLHLPRSVTTSSVRLNPTCSFLYHLLIWSFCWSFLICKTYFELALQIVAHELEVELWLLKCGLTHSSARAQQGNRCCALFCFFQQHNFDSCILVDVEYVWFHFSKYWLMKDFNKLHWWL